MSYIHYGDDKFERTKFARIKEREDGPWIKPTGGLWASYIWNEHALDDADDRDWRIDWKDWCLSNDYKVFRLNKSFIFDLKPDAKIFEVDSMYDIRKLEKLGVYASNNFWYYTKMTKLEELGYDGIRVWMSPDIYDALYGWDCDSILIFNPDCIIPQEA